MSPNEMHEANKISGCHTLWVRGEFDYKGVTGAIELFRYLD